VRKKSFSSVARAKTSLEGCESIGFVCGGFKKYLKVKINVLILFLNFHKFLKYF
jgi:hypothetical protein